MRKHGCLFSAIIVLIGFATVVTICTVDFPSTYKSVVLIENLGSFAIALIVVGFIWAIIALIQRRVDYHDEAINKSDAERLEMRKELDKQATWLSERFSVDKHISCFTNGSLLSVAVDSAEKVLIIGKGAYKFNEIVGSELITSESHTSTTTTQKNNGIGRAVVGGVIAGGAGAIVGAATAKGSGTTQTHSVTNVEGVCIYLSDVVNPMITLRGDESFNRDDYATVQAIISQNRISGTGSFA